ncbi:hypothetical protein TIFTF001_007936 [Ficus carica]|uniref:Uncharacterized protein n=1 Tax=Ficus carica TaxID=3494 RepID=A0AA87ZS50_FICCA|nr:hypothetical protein TIFTF001_007936 [Ficus carica]
MIAGIPKARPSRSSQCSNAHTGVLIHLYNLLYLWNLVLRKVQLTLHVIGLFFLVFTQAITHIIPRRKSTTMVFRKRNLKSMISSHNILKRYVFYILFYSPVDLFKLRSMGTSPSDRGSLWGTAGVDAEALVHPLQLSMFGRMPFRNQFQDNQ